MCCSHSSLRFPQANTLLFSPMTPLPTFLLKLILFVYLSSFHSEIQFTFFVWWWLEEVLPSSLSSYAPYSVLSLTHPWLSPPSFWLIYMKWRLPSDPEETSSSSPVHTMICAGFVCTGVHILEFTNTCILNVLVLNYTANCLVQKKSWWQINMNTHINALAQARPYWQTYTHGYTPCSTMTHSVSNRLEQILAVCGVLGMY